MPVLFALGLALGLLFLFLGFRVTRRKRLIADVPTSKALGVFIGAAELKGTAESDAPLTGYLSGTSCVYYAYSVDEQWSRTVTETYTDAKGNRQTRTKTETGWKTVSSDLQNPPFYLKDDSGVIRIIPSGAQVQPVTSFNQTVSARDPLYFTKGPDTVIPDSTHHRRFTERNLPLHGALYIFGQARERQDIAAAEIAKDKDADIFIISTRSEKQVSSGISWGASAWMVLAFLLISGGSFMLYFDSAASKLDIGRAVITAIGVFLGALFIGWLVMVFNSLINLRHMVERAWSQVDIQLKRRFDLIPNLEAAVKGYAAHEKEVQTLVTELRAQAEATPPGVKGPDYKGVMPSLRIIAERYPELKASESFLSLQKSLTDTEERIALARDYFNNIATAYNTRLAVIPDRFVGVISGLKPRALMSAADFERAPVVVKLAD
jgi:hypothetical protein